MTATVDIARIGSRMNEVTLIVACAGRTDASDGEKSAIGTNSTGIISLRKVPMGAGEITPVAQATIEGTMSSIAASAIDCASSSGVLESVEESVGRVFAEFSDATVPVSILFFNLPALSCRILQALSFFGQASVHPCKKGVWVFRIWNRIKVPCS